MILEKLKEKIEKITFAFQPIIDLRSKRIFGFEALIRNYHLNGYQNIFEFFDEAFENKTLYSLDILLREKAIHLFIQIPEYQKRRIFYNIDNRILEMPDFESGNTIRILKKFQLPNSCFIFEISERIPFQSYESLSDVILNYKKQGFKIAIDDFGVGYSSLQLIYSSEPDVIKLDRFFISEIDSDLRKKLFVDNIVKIAHLIGGIVVAEGVETYEELLTCIELGIDLAQGYYICEPFFVDEYSQKISKLKELFYALEFNQLYFNKKNETISENLKIQSVPPLEITMHIEEILEHLKKHSEFSVFPVINEYREPIGIIKEKNLKVYLLHQYTRELWKYKNFSEFLEKNLEKAFIFESNTEISHLIEILSQNENIGIKSIKEIVITEKGRYKGIIFSEEILKFIFEQKLITVRDQNPLTNLPGNQAISNFLRKNHNLLGTFSIIYLDIKDFKPFNDTFGFEEGDKLIFYIGNYLKKFTFYKDTYFVGHIGGDDFIVFIKNKSFFHTLRFVLQMQKQFENFVKNLLPKNKENCYYAKNRYGIEQKFNFPILSAGILYFQNGEIPLQKISPLLAEVKKNSKNNHKNIYYTVF